MEIELLSKEESEVRPAGKARDEPNINPVLEEPKYVFIFFKVTILSLELPLLVAHDALGGIPLTLKVPFAKIVVIAASVDQDQAA